MKRLFLFSAFILCSLATMAGDFEVDGICYNITSTNNLLTVEVTSSSSDYSGDIVIPRQVEYGGNTYSVTSISRWAFERCSGLTSVTIPNSVTSIGESAFSGCYYLQKVIVEDIAAWCNISFGGSDSNPLKYAHYLYLNGQEVKDLVIPNSVTSIGNYAFYGCYGLGFVTIPNSVTSIGDRAFYDCHNVTEVTIPNSVTSIGDRAFSGFWSDTYIIVEEGNTKYDSRDNCNALIETSTNTLIAGFKNTVIPNSVTSIGNCAFYYCSGLTEVTIPNSVTSIGNDAFYDCYGLQKVIVEDIAAWCNISFGSSDSNPLYYAQHLYLNGQEVKDLVIPNSVTSIGDDAFYGCVGLTSVTIPSSVTSIESAVFYGCSGLTSVTVEMETPLTIDSEAFTNRANATLYVPVGSKAAYQAANYWKEFKEIVEYGDITFADANVKAICVQNWDTDGDGELDVDEAAAVTDLGSVFKQNSTITTFDELRYFTGLRSIGSCAFINCSGLTSVTIPNSVTTIGYEAFSQCHGLTSVTIPNSVTSIGDGAFYHCFGLTSVTIPNSVTSIGQSVFAWCSGLTSVTIPNSVTSIGEGAFRGCSGLTSITIPNSVTTIGNNAFFDCSNLIYVKVEKNTPPSIYNNSSDLDSFSNIDSAILYVPRGSWEVFYRTYPWGRQFVAVVEFPNSDVNQDGAVNMVDAVDIARFVVGIPRENFVEFLADLNNSGEVNVADAVVLVNEIAGDQNFAKAYGAPRQELGDDRLMLTENGDHTLSFSMESQRPYTAFQFDLYTNSEDDVMNLRLNAARKNGHQLLYNKVDEGHYRVVALSVANNGFNGNNGELLKIQLDGLNSADMTIGNIHFITTDGTDHRFDDLSLSGATGIESLTPNPSPEGEGNIYDLSGRKVSEFSVLPKGVYIVNGKKVIVK